MADAAIPLTTATLVPTTPTAKEASLTKAPSKAFLSRNPSRSRSVALDTRVREKSSTFLFEPAPEDTLPPPVNPWSDALREKIMLKLGAKPRAENGQAFLRRYQWPEGLQMELLHSCRRIPLRFYVVDDSGSMISDDGRRVISQGAQHKMIKCTRWAELSESVLFLAELAEALQVPTEFRLVNGADPILVGLDEPEQEIEEGGQSSLAFLREVMRESPAGPTPLCAHIRAIVANIESIAPSLRERGQKAVVVIATDGESTDGDVALALKPLTHLPVLVVVRLCTEENSVLDYWNNIDQQLELDIDVLDDQLGDARQVAAVNGWLTYAEPLHRIREFGVVMKEMDIIDEKTITMEQMRAFCAFLLCKGDIEALPHPALNWNLFAAALKEALRQHEKVFCPVSQTVKPWIDVPALYRTYAKEIKSNQPGSCSLS
eukprot:gene2769-3023_t